MLLTDLPLELRALIWETMTLHTLIKMIRSLPNYIQEFLDSIRVIQSDNEKQSVDFCILRDIPLVQTIEPPLSNPVALKVQTNVQSVSVKATTGFEVETVLSLLFDGVRKITILNWNGNQVLITGRTVEVHSIVQGLTATLLVLTAFRDKIDRFVIREESLISSTGEQDLVKMFIHAVKWMIPKIEYELPTKKTMGSVQKIYSDYDLSEHFRKMNVYLVTNSEWLNLNYTPLLELVIPLPLISVDMTLGRFPDLTKIGFLLCMIRGYANSGLASLLEKYPRVTFVVFTGAVNPDFLDWRDNENINPAPWLKTHPRVILARQK